jgi:hypothetical protein
MWDHDVSNGEQSQKLAVWGNTLAALGRLRWYGTAYQKTFDLAFASLAFSGQRAEYNGQAVACAWTGLRVDIFFSRRKSGGEVRM